MLFRQLMTCTGMEGAADVVDKFAAHLRTEVVSAIVKDRIARGVQTRPAR